MPTPSLKSPFKERKREIEREKERERERERERELPVKTVSSRVHVNVLHRFKDFWHVIFRESHPVIMPVGEDVKSHRFGNFLGNRAMIVLYYNSHSKHQDRKCIIC